MPPQPVPLAVAMPIAEALRASAPLGRLAERLRRSNALFAAIAPVVPPGLAAWVSAGPIDDEGWSLLCANAAVAAKLRQLVPHLEERLREVGEPVAAIRVKVQPR
ncbi:MAG TPA: DciA family protein [Caldimonas sp.]|nr:DciA family protein [Caldimonas sp.]